MKKIVFAIIALSISSAIFIACTKEDNQSVTKENALSLIKKDISSKKFYPNVKNKYDYSSVNLRKFVNINSDLLNNTNANNNTSRINPTLNEYKSAVIDFYQNSEHNSEEINERFESSLSAINQFADYDAMLDSLIANGTIPQEEKDIIDYYIDTFFIVNDSADLNQITTTFIYYINQSDFSEFEKRGMLTIFDVFKANKEMIKEGENYKFLQFFQENGTNPNGKPTLEQICAGNIITGLLFGAATGNGIGACIGLASGLWADYTAGCMG